MLCLYPRNERIEIPNNGNINKDINLSQIISSEFSIRSIVADALQVPLQLKWYDVHVDNISIRLDEECIKYGPGQPVVAIKFLDKQAPNKYKNSSNLLSQSEYDEFISEYNKEVTEKEKVGTLYMGDYYVLLGKEGVFIYKGDENLNYRLMGGASEQEIISRSGECSQVIDKLYATSTFAILANVYATPNLTAWWVKFVILFLLLSSLGTMFLSLLGWARNR